MIIIGLTGPAGSGKSTLAHYLVNKHNFAEMAFADPIRDMVAALLGITRLALDLQLADREWKEAKINEIDASPRRLMQTLGTEWGRHLIHSGLWVSLMNERLQDYLRGGLNGFAGVVISDVRFENEADFIRTRGLLLHVARPDLARIDQHESETGIRTHHRDQLVLNHSIELLHKQADSWVAELQRGLAA